MDDRMLDITAKYQDNETVDCDKIDKDFTRAIEEVKKRGKELMKLPSNTELLAQRILKLINDSLQTARYFFGLLIALLDLLSGKMEKDFSNYFSEQNSYVSLYFRNGRSNNKFIRSSLRFYAVKSKYKGKLISIRKVIEQYIFGRYKDLRIDFAHWDADARQDLLPDEIYTVKVKKDNVPYTIQKLEEIWGACSTLFLWFKFLVAREFYSDADLISYVRERPKPRIFHVYPGEMVKKKE